MSTLLEKASLVMIPSGYKEDVVYSEIPTDGSGDIQFTRASDGTRVNSQGLVERVPWNLLQQSNTFNTTWLSNGTTETGGQAGYDGTNDAWLLQRNDGLSRFVYQTTAFNSLTTFSVYAKAGNVDWLFLANGVGENHYFDLANGVLGNTGTAIDATIESAGNGYYRCSIVISNCSEVRIYPAINDGVISGLVGANIYIQDAQLNEGSTAKPYFPTTDRQNVPRLDYSGGCPSLLLEPQRTNLALYSEQFDNGAWSKSGVTITANNTTSPDGTQNADLLDDGTANADHYVNINVTTASSTTYVQSAYFKKKDSGIYASLRTNGVGSNSFVVFDFDTASIVGVGTQIDDYGVVSYANGWYRVWMKYTLAPTGYIIGVSNNSSSAIPSYAGTNKGFYVWGAQLEAGSYPTSYIPTTSASVTRVADEASKTGISSLIGQTEGTLFVEVDTAVLGDVFAGINRRFLSISDGTTDNRIFINQDRATDAIGVGVITSATLVAAISTASNQSGIKKIAVGYANNDFVMYVNGVQIGTDTSGSVPACSRVGVGSAETSSITANAACPVSQAALFKTRLTNAELASLTTL